MNGFLKGYNMLKYPIFIYDRVYKLITVHACHMVIMFFNLVNYSQNSYDII